MFMTKTVAFVGGSIVAGIGFTNLSKNLNIYPNLVASKLDFKVLNYGKGGANNNEIFVKSLQALIEPPEILVIEWNNLHRFRFYPAPNISMFVSADRVGLPESDRVPYFTQKELNVFQKILILSTHDYHEIIKILEYCEIISSMCESKNTNLVMINGSVPWTSDLDCDIINSDLSKSLSNFTKQMISFDTRDDLEIIELLETLRKKNKIIPKEIWAADQFYGINHYKVDYAPLDNHPGPETHKIIAQNVYDNLLNRNII